MILINNSITPRQLWVLCAVAMLSPFLRLVPGSVVELAGSVGWLSAALSILPAGLLVWFLGKFSTKGGLIVGIFRCLGLFLGCVVVSCLGIWLVFHSGFVLRSGAQRFTDTIYPNGGMEMMLLFTGIFCGIAAMGRVKPLARASEVFWPMMLFVILLVIVFSLKDIDPGFLLPVRWQQLSDVAMGLPMAAESAGVALLLGAFALQYLPAGTPPPRLWTKLLFVTILNVLVCVVAIGNLGSVYTGTLDYPGFILARDLSILSGVERVEALIVGLWLLPDFVLVTLELILAGECFAAVRKAALASPAQGEVAEAKRRPEGSTQQASDTLPCCDNPSVCNSYAMLQTASRQATQALTQGSQVLLTAIAIFIAFRIAPEGQSLRYLSTSVVPAFQLIWAYWIVPFVFLIGKLRRKF